MKGRYCTLLPFFSHVFLGPVVHTTAPKNLSHVLFTMKANEWGVGVVVEKGSSILASVLQKGLIHPPEAPALWLRRFWVQGACLFLTVTQSFLSLMDVQ